jgi:ATP-dependent DNA helicase RecQ
MNLTAELQKYFGYTTFRNGQAEIIQALLAGQSTLGILPTGQGKSLCYQLPTYLLGGSTLIVSPLISLMEDQVRQLQQRGEKHVIALNSQLDFLEKRYVLEHLAYYRFIFASPEMLQNEEVLAALGSLSLKLLVVDEAHCVSQWGVDFRPDYLLLRRVQVALKQPLTLALTATATPKVQQDIVRTLFTKQSPYVHYESVNRANISLLVEVTENKLARLTTILGELAGAGIIYCATRKNVETVYQALKAHYPVAFYHGGLSGLERTNLQNQFLNGKLTVLIATNAFGMGINKEDIRFVIHYELPDSLENYLQEIGRAGRDGKRSQALLLYQPNDERIHHFFQEQQTLEFETFKAQLQAANNPSQFSELGQKWLAAYGYLGTSLLTELTAQQQIRRNKLKMMLRYIYLESCRRQFLLEYFSEKIPEKKQEMCCDRDGATLLLENKSVGQSIEQPEPADWQTIFLNLF